MLDEASMTQAFPFFLGVERSFAGRPWRARLDAAGEARALAIAQTGGCDELLARVLAGRGVGLDEVARHLDPTLRALMPDPFTLRRHGEGDGAARRRGQARARRVAIFADYDVDGAASAALLSEYLQACGCETIVHIPDRVTEGYGPNREAMAAFAARGASLVVTVDCGAVSHEPIAEARKLGLDVVVFDHHQAPERLPDALAIVDPNRQDDLSGLGHLCAAGVVYMGLVALNRALRDGGFFNGRAAPDLLAGLDLVALATVADVVPLVGLNRAFVARGLAAMRQRKRPGLAALFDAAGADGPPRAYHLGFLIGPRINAGGRIGDAALGVKLLTTRDEDEARKIAAELDRLNRARQQIEIATLAEAEAEALVGARARGARRGGRRGGRRLAGRRRRPRRGAAQGALRAPRLRAGAQRRRGDRLGALDRRRRSRPRRARRGRIRPRDQGRRPRDGGGNHARQDSHRRVPRLSRGEARRRRWRRRAARSGLSIDAALTAAGATVALAQSVEAAGPFGAGNPEPVFALPRHRLTGVFAAGADHLRLRAVAADGAAIEAIAFRVVGKPLGEALLNARGASVHLAGALTINRYGGREKPQLRLIDAAEVAD